MLALTWAPAPACETAVRTHFSREDFMRKGIVRIVGALAFILAVVATLSGCGRSTTTDAAGGKQRRTVGHGRHRDAHQVVRAVGRRRQQHGRAVQEARLRHRPAVRRRRRPEPGLADREHDHQGRQGAGDRAHRQLVADRHPAACRRRQDPGRQLRPPDPRHRERQLLRHLRQLQGRRPAGHLHRRQAGPRTTARAPSTSSCSPGPPTTTTRRSSSRAR